jgi:hypothetical protein
MVANGRFHAPVSGVAWTSRSRAILQRCANNPIEQI